MGPVGAHWALIVQKLLLNTTLQKLSYFTKKKIKTVKQHVILTGKLCIFKPQEQLKMTHNSQRGA